MEEAILMPFTVLMGFVHFDLDMKDFSYSLSELTDSKFIIFLGINCCICLEIS